MGFSGADGLGLGIDSSGWPLFEESNSAGQCLSSGPAFLCQGRGAQPGWALQLSGDVPVPCQTSYSESLGASVLREWMKREECAALALGSVERESVGFSVMSNSLRPHGPWPHQTPLSMEFSRHKNWSGLPFPSPEDLPGPGIKPRSPAL